MAYWIVQVNFGSICRKVKKSMTAVDLEIASSVQHVRHKRAIFE